MINSQPLIDRICCALTVGGLTALQCCQAENALTLLCQPVCSVASISNLPNACTYNGRMIYVCSENKYYYSVKGVWNSDFTTAPHKIACYIYAWGTGTTGRLGDNTITGKSSPVSVVSGFTNWSQITAGCCQAFGIRNNSTLWGWGYNYCGLLGDNTVINRSSPVSVVGGFTDWCQASSGQRQSQGLRQNGTLWAWGHNNYGQLGDNTTVSKSSPVSVVGGFTDWCQIASGQIHSLASRTNGTIWAWGSGNNGRLGDNTIVSKSSPVSVVGGFTDWCQVAAGQDHSLAVRQTGTAWAWGVGLQGRLGDNTTVSKSSPVSVVGGFTDWCQISGGINFSLAVRQNGTAWAWGYNAGGQLGDNTVVDKSSPVSVVGGFTDWCQISGGQQHSLAVRQNGTAWAWGCNSCGQLGDNTVTTRSSPVSVVSGFTNWSQVSGGSCFSVGRTVITVPIT